MRLIHSLISERLLIVILTFIYYFDQITKTSKNLGQNNLRLLIMNLICIRLISVVGLQSGRTESTETIPIGPIIVFVVSNRYL